MLILFLYFFSLSNKKVIRKPLKTKNKLTPIEAILYLLKKATIQ